MATAEETRAAAFRASLRARAASAKAREAAMKGDPAALAALKVKTTPLIPDDPDGRP